MKTPAEARKFWVDGLRSGRFKQGVWALESDGRQCCLGVACRLFIEDGGDLNVNEAYGITIFSGCQAVLPEDVQNWLGLATNNGHTVQPVDTHYSSLMHLNDNGYSFDQIADIIEKGGVLCQNPRLLPRPS